MSNWMIIYDSSDDLMHYGIKGRSGRKKGSGKGSIRYINGKRVRYKKNTFIGELRSRPKKKTDTQKILSIVRMKNVSDQMKANYLKKMMAGMSQADMKKVFNEMSKHGANNKDLAKIRQLIAGKFNNKATLNTGRPRVNSAYDARPYLAIANSRRVQMAEKRKRAVAARRPKKS